MNENQGVLALVLFGLALVLGWISGLFRTLRQRPKFRIEVLEGPTLCCVVQTGREHNTVPTHRTAISLYLKVTNVGSAPSSVAKVAVGYRMPPIRTNWLWLTKGVFRHWIRDTHVALSDFRINIGTSVKVYPFLLQRSFISGERDTYLEVGQQVIGVVYFEEQEAWGSYQPRTRNVKVKVKILLTDAFGGRHSANAMIPRVDIQEARRFCPDFGRSLESLREPDSAGEQTT